MIIKYLVFVLAIFFIYVIFFKKNRDRNIKDKHDNIADTMVECPKCQIYVSKDDAILSNGKYFCSKGCIK
jgi:uncharacterized protein